MPMIQPLTRRHTVSALLALSGLSLAQAAQAQGSPFVGTFTATLQAGAMALRLKLVVSPDLKAVLYSVDQGNSAIPASQVDVTPTAIVLVFAVIGARYEGTLSDKDHISGTFTQGGSPLPLNFTRGDSFPARPEDGPLTAESLRALRIAAATPGMAAGWNRKGAQTAFLADGVRAAGSPAPVTAQDKWHVGSMTKSMTATLAGRCVEAGRIGWQTTIGEILGGKIPGMAEVYKPVTLLHLLSHRGGIQPNPAPAEIETFSRAPLADPRPERLRYAALALGAPPVAEAGAKMVYSNSGYVIAGAMLEAVTGTSWEELITSDLFAPLGMTSAGFGAPEGAQPSGHSIAADRTRTAVHTDNPVAMGPCGRVHLSAADLVTYLSAHRDRPESLLTAGTWKTLHTPPFGGDYALGWVVSHAGNLWHNGSNTLWYAEGLVDFEQDVVAAAVANDAASFSGAPGGVLLAARKAALV